MGDFVFDFKGHTDEELAREWQRLDVTKASPYVEAKADAIEKELSYRGVYAWDSQGNITQRRE